MSIALHSAALAAKAYLQGETAEDFQTRLATNIGGQVWRATWLSRLCVRRGAQCGLLTATRLLPALLTLGVALTRVPERSLDLGRPG
jgi:hypothetical protein